MEEHESILSKLFTICGRFLKGRVTYKIVEKEKDVNEVFNIESRSEMLFPDIFSTVLPHLLLQDLKPQKRWLC